MSQRDGPALPGALLECAEQYVEAAALLASACEGRSAEPICLVARHGVELALRAYLAHSGASRDDVTGAQHDLLRLWVCAHSKGLPIESSPPYWVQAINFAFDRPFLTPARPGHPPSATPSPQAIKQSLDDLLRTTADAIYRIE